MCPVCHKKGKEHSRDVDSLGFGLPFLWGCVQHQETSTVPDQENLLLLFGKNFLKLMKNVSYQSLVYVSHQKCKY